MAYFGNGQQPTNLKGECIELKVWISTVNGHHRERVQIDTNQEISNRFEVGIAVYKIQSGSNAGDQVTPSNECGP